MIQEAGGSLPEWLLSPPICFVVRLGSKIRKNYERQRGSCFSCLQNHNPNSRCSCTSMMGIRFGITEKEKQCLALVKGGLSCWSQSLSSVEKGVQGVRVGKVSESEKPCLVGYLNWNLGKEWTGSRHIFLKEFFFDFFRWNFFGDCFSIPIRIIYREKNRTIYHLRKGENSCSNGIGIAVWVKVIE